MVLALAACGPNAESPQASTDGAEPTADTGGSQAPAPSGDGSTGALDASGDLFVFGFSYDSTDDVVARTRVEYTEEQYPDLNVSFSESGFESTGFLTSLQSDDPPDVVRISRDIIGTYISSGRLAPLDECIANSGIDTSIYREAAIEQLTSDGTLYALPDFFDTAVWMAATAEFEEDGVDPNLDWSDWDAIAAANEQLLTMDGDQVGEIGIDPKVAGDYSFFTLWVYANGGQLLSDDGTESLLDTPEVLEALEFTKGIIDAHGGITPFLDFRNNPELNGDFFGAPNQFDLGTEAAFPMQQWYLNVAAENSPDTELTVSSVSGEFSAITLRYHCCIGKAASVPRSNWFGVPKKSPLSSTLLRKSRNSLVVPWASMRPLVNSSASIASGELICAVSPSSLRSCPPLA
jgi:multiple sugar transport system substrate-binding protein